MKDTLRFFEKMMLMMAYVVAWSVRYIIAWSVMDIIAWSMVMWPLSCSELWSAEAERTEKAEKLEVEAVERTESRNVEVVRLIPTRFTEVKFPELSPEEWQNFEKMRQELMEQDYMSAFPKLRGFLILSAEKQLPDREDSKTDSGNIHETVTGMETGTKMITETDSGSVPEIVTEKVAETGTETVLGMKTCGRVCTELIAGLPEEGMRKWREFTDKTVSTALKSAFRVAQESAGKSGEIPEKVLKQLLRENPYSAYEAEMLELLALHAWQLGKMEKAWTLWERELAVMTEDECRREAGNPVKSENWIASENPVQGEKPTGKEAGKETANHTEKKSGKKTSPGIGQKTVILDEIPSQNTQEERLFAVHELLRRKKSGTNSSTEKNMETDSELETKLGTLSVSGWTVTMTEVRTPEGVTVFEDFLPSEQRGTLFRNRKRNRVLENQAFPEFLTFSSDGNFLVARLGTQVTRWPTGEVDTRPQAYLVVLETARDGFLVCLATPETVQRVLVGNPLADENYVYVPTVEIGTRAEFALDIYSLADGMLLRRNTLFSASWEDIKIENDTEMVYLPIQWTESGDILIGGSNSGVEMVWKL
ncbi:MAG: hypothetical protein Q4C70_07405 [Planctomycetia bacterium]|nr:hypothetical protein [Planctomycetia bacterium]